MERTSPPPSPRPSDASLLDLLNDEAPPTVREVTLMAEVVKLSRERVELMKLFNDMKKELVNLTTQIEELRKERDECMRQMEQAEKDKISTVQICQQREQEPQSLACWMKTALSVSLITSVGVGGAMLFFLLV